MRKKRKSMYDSVIEQQLREEESRKAERLKDHCKLGSGNGCCPLCGDRCSWSPFFDAGGRYVHAWCMIELVHPTGKAVRSWVDKEFIRPTLRGDEVNVLRTPTPLLS